MFVTKFLLDPDNTDVLYYVSDNRLYRTDGAETVTASTWTEMTGVGNALEFTEGTFKNQIFSLAVTRGPYSESSKLYIGDTSGKIYRLDNPRDAAADAAPVEITPAGATTLPSTTVSSLAVDPDDDQVLMATYSNFNIPSIFVSMDGGAGWTDVEGNLSLSSIRTCAVANINGVRNFFVGTSAGLWRTSALNGADTVWVQEGPSTIRLATVEALVLRPVDNTLLVGTFGNGLFSLDLNAGGTGTRLEQRYQLPEIQVDVDDLDTAVSILNPNDAEARLEVFAFTDEGALVGEAAITSLAPHALHRFTVKEAFPDRFISVDWIEVGSDLELVAFAELMSEDARSAYASSRMEQSFYLPHIAKNTNLFETVLTTVNGSTEQISSVFTDFPIGDPHPLEKADAPFGRSSRAMTNLLGDDLNNGPDLWGMVTGSADSVAGMEYFTRLPGRTQQAGLGLNGQKGQTVNFLHIAADTARFWTGMVYINVAETAANATETYFDETGNVLLARPVNLQPSGEGDPAVRQRKSGAGSARVRLASGHR